jgi:signal transduction histidine kinase
MFADAVHAHGSGGLGLGLAVVRALAEAQRGDMAIESAPGAGTTVSIRFAIGDQIAKAA